MDPLGMSVGGGEVARSGAKPERASKPEAPVKAGESEEGRHEQKDARDGQFEKGDESGSREFGLSGSVVTYSVDKKTLEVVAKVVDRDSGEVVREVPSEQLRDMQRALEEAGKRLFDKTA